MACSCILNEYVLSCRDNIGGIQRVYIGCYDSDVVFSLDGDNMIDGVSGPTVSYYKFEQEIETGSFVQNGQFSTENPATFCQNSSVCTIKTDSSNQSYISLTEQFNSCAVDFVW